MKKIVYNDRSGTLSGRIFFERKKKKKEKQKKEKEKKRETILTTRFLDLVNE